jgi:hypothetical protein
MVPAPAEVRLNANRIDLIALQRTACLGPCPVFEVELRRDGRVIYHGREHARLSGPRTGHLGRESFDELAGTVATCAFDELTGDYVPHITCIPLAITRVGVGARSLLVMSSTSRGPLSLEHLHERIESVLDDVTWDATPSERLLRASQRADRGAPDEDVRPPYDEPALLASMRDAHAIHRIALTSVGGGTAFASSLALEIVRSGVVWYRNGLDGEAFGISRGALRVGDFARLADIVARSGLDAMRERSMSFALDVPDVTVTVTTPNGARAVTSGYEAPDALRELRRTIVGAIARVAWEGDTPASVREQLGG